MVSPFAWKSARPRQEAQLPHLAPAPFKNRYRRALSPQLLRGHRRPEVTQGIG